MAGACGGVKWDGRVVRGEGYALVVGPIPSTWAPLDVSDAALAFRDEPNGAVIALGARCGQDAEDVPLAALTKHLFIHFTERNITAQETFPFDGREALRTTLDAKLDGVEKRFEIVVLKKDGCVYDWMYIAEPARFESGIAAFRGFTMASGTADP